MFSRYFIFIFSFVSKQRQGVCIQSRHIFISEKVPRSNRAISSSPALRHSSSSFMLASAFPHISFKYSSSSVDKVSNSINSSLGLFDVHPGHSWHPKSPSFNSRGTNKIDLLQCIQSLKSLHRVSLRSTVTLSQQRNQKCLP